jgi:hypothetical protein
LGQGMVSGVQWKGGAARPWHKLLQKRGLGRGQHPGHLLCRASSAVGS